MTSRERQAKPIVGSADRTIQDLFAMNGRTVAITGGGGAVALEAARSVLESGGDVVCLDRQDSPLPEPWKLVQEAAKTHNGRAWYYQCDVSNDQQVRDTFATAVSKARYPLRGLLCCAGISMGGPSIDFSTELARRHMDVNVIGPLSCAQAFAREMQKNGLPGSVVFIASMSAHRSNKGVDTAAYNSSKAAVVQLARSLAAEWGSRADIPLIRVNTISPGYIHTRMTVDTLMDPDIKAQWTHDSMLFRLSEAHEYRGAIMYLLSDASSFVTGSDVRVDGGHTAW